MPTLTTTFKGLRTSSACISSYKKLAKNLGGIRKYGANTPINLLVILDSNGITEAIWCLRATEQNCDQISRLMAADFAESVLHLFEAEYPGDIGPRQTIQVARDFANGLVDAATMSAASDFAMSTARSAKKGTAWSAAWSAAGSAAEYAAWSAAEYAAEYATWSAAGSATCAAAWDATKCAAEQLKQAEIFKKYLSNL